MSPHGEAPPAPPTRSALVRTFLRSFTIQGSWNYRTMLGNGFAYSLLPVLREVHGGEGVDRAVATQAESFNAHPYLTGVALGAVARMEAEGADDDAVRRFKAAVGGPLGGLGDALVWAAFLPATMLFALVLAWMGAEPWIAVLVFLGVYNAGHLTLRVWGFYVGLREGRAVGGRLRRSGLGRRTESVARVGSALAGLFLGLVLLREPGFADPRWLWGVLAAGAVVTGLVGGQKVWRPAAFSVVGVVVGIVLVRAVLMLFL